MGGNIFIKGLIVGLLIATPVGPIAVLCIQRTLNRGRIHGIVSGLGAAAADAFYGFVAVFGLTVISSFVIREQRWLRLIGGILLCYMGVRAFLSKPVQRTTSGNGTNYFGDFISAFFLTLANPATFIAFAAIFAGLGLAEADAHYSAVGSLVGGVFVGSAIWWLTLSSVAGGFLEKLGYGKLTWLNKVAGIIIAGFGLFVLLSLIWTTATGP
jgi:threonine/homoserine/homoserine lactone efflux protein